MGRVRWVFLAYRMPREPSTPRIAAWLAHVDCPSSPAIRRRACPSQPDVRWLSQAPCSRRSVRARTSRCLPYRALEMSLDVTPNAGTRPRHSRDLCPLGLDGVSEGIAVGVLAHEARVDDVRGLCGESRDAARRTDRCSPDVGVFALAHARHHRRRARSASTCLKERVPLNAG